MRLKSFHCLPVLLEKYSEKLFSLPCIPLETRAAKNLAQGHLMWPEELPNPFILYLIDKVSKKQNLPELTVLWGKRGFFPRFFCGKIIQCVSFCWTQRKYGCGKNVISCRDTGTQTHTDVCLADCLLLFIIIWHYISLHNHFNIQCTAMERAAASSPHTGNQ